MENIENIENMEKMENINQVSYRRLGGKCFFHWTRSPKALPTPPPLCGPLRFKISMFLNILNKGGGVPVFLNFV